MRGNLAEDVFHHEDGAVHQDPEVHRADGQQVCRGTGQVKAEKRKQQRQRNGDGNDQPGAQVVEEKQQHDDDQHHAAQQILLDHLRGLRDQVAEVVVGVDLHVTGQQVRVELLRPGLDPGQYILGLLALAHQDDAFHRVIRVLEAKLAQPWRGADDDPPDVLQQHGRAVVHGQHHVADILQRVQPTQPTHVVKLPALRVEPAAGIAVVGRQRRFNLGYRQADGSDFGLIQQHLILHGAAAKTRVIGHARHGAVLRRDDPILQRLQLHRRAVGALQYVAVDQPGWCRQRRDGRRHPIGQAQVAHAVEHLLAREVVVGAVLEREHHIGQPVQRHRALRRGLRHAAHAQLDRHRDQSLHFLGGMSRPLRDDIHHRRRQVRVRIHRQMSQRPHASAHQYQGQQDGDEALSERSGDNPVHQRRRARRQ